MKKLSLAYVGYFLIGLLQKTHILKGLLNTNEIVFGILFGVSNLLSIFPFLIYRWNSHNKLSSFVENVNSKRFLDAIILLYLSIDNKYQPYTYINLNYLLSFLRIVILCSEKLVDSPRKTESLKFVITKCFLHFLAELIMIEYITDYLFSPIQSYRGGEFFKHLTVICHFYYSDFEMERQGQLLYARIGFELYFYQFLDTNKLYPTSLPLGLLYLIIKFINNEVYIAQRVSFTLQEEWNESLEDRLEQLHNILQLFNEQQYSFILSIKIENLKSKTYRNYSNFINLQAAILSQLAYAQTHLKQITNQEGKQKYSICGIFDVEFSLQNYNLIGVITRKGLSKYLMTSQYLIKENGQVWMNDSYMNIYDRLENKKSYFLSDQEIALLSSYRMINDPFRELFAFKGRKYQSNQHVLMILAFQKNLTSNMTLSQQQILEDIYEVDDQLQIIVQQ